MGVPFYSLSGGGNDFLALLEPESMPTAETIRLWCRRGLGVGADGLFVLRRERGGVRMDHFNADGEAAELCLNGSRCAARLATEVGWIDGRGTLLTGAGAIQSEALPSDRAALELDRPAAEPLALELDADGEAVAGYQIRVGVPHFVISTKEALDEDLDAAPVADLAPILRAHPRFAPEGANVDFVRFHAPHRLDIRTFERGVEAETLACGSGVLAAVATGLVSGGLELPVAATTRGGFVLEVNPGESDSTWTLVGDARLVARGEILPGAAAHPPRHNG